jgi:hypothetical protein
MAYGPLEDIHPNCSNMIQNSKDNKLVMVVLSVIPALGRLREEDYEFEASLAFILNSRPAWATE